MTETNEWKPADPDFVSGMPWMIKNNVLYVGEINTHHHQWGTYDPASRSAEGSYYDPEATANGKIWYPGAPAMKVVDYNAPWHEQETSTLAALVKALWPEAVKNGGQLPLGGSQEAPGGAVSASTKELDWLPVHEDADAQNGLQRVSDYQGWTNWETWNTKLMMDNERELYDHSRQIGSKEELAQWALTSIIGPHNQEEIRSAQGWNDIPQHDRLDPRYEDLKEQNPQAADIVDQLGLGADVSDSEPQIIDPELVNWDEIFASIQEENEENRRYEQGLPATWEEPQPDPDAPGTMTLPGDWRISKDWMEKSMDTWQGGGSGRLYQNREIPGETGARTMDGINAPAVDDNWLYLNGEVIFGGHYWDLAHLLATKLKLPDEQVRLVSNSVARMHLPADMDIAYGEMRGGYPQIWASTLDRNHVWDAVAREHGNNPPKRTAASLAELPPSMHNQYLQNLLQKRPLTEADLAGLSPEQAYQYREAFGIPQPGVWEDSDEWNPNAPRPGYDGVDMNQFKSQALAIAHRFDAIESADGGPIDGAEDEIVDWVYDEGWDEKFIILNGSKGVVWGDGEVGMYDGRWAHADEVSGYLDEEEVHQIDHNTNALGWVRKPPLKDGDKPWVVDILSGFSLTDEQILSALTLNPGEAIIERDGDRGIFGGAW